ncbi:MAG: AAA family ATPase [Pseudomonadota bacterium]
MPAYENRDPETAPRDAAAALRDWAERYGKAVEAGSEPALKTIGTEMLGWLDRGNALSAWLAGPERALEVRIDPATPDALDEPLLAAPWELLCRANAFLAEESTLFTVARRCTSGTDPGTARYKDFALMFMAAAVEGTSELDYEAEEAAILQATQAEDGRALAHVQVEESGALDFLRERMRLDGPFEALHLSCHGDIRAGEGGADPVPVLMLEKPAGGGDEVDPERLLERLGDAVPPLIFVSACRTAERGAGRKGFVAPPAGLRDRGLAEDAAAFAAQGPSRDGAGEMPGETAPDLAEPYVRRLARQAANVIGWDGSVYDIDATRFAETLYDELSRGATVPRAAARARRALFRSRADDPRLGRHWHLARVYLGPGGGGALCDPDNPEAETRPEKPPAEDAFLDPNTRRVPVAPRAAFVGRRRQIQRALRVFAETQANKPRSLLVHGMGNLGKSSLAARIAARMPRHRTAVVYGRVTPDAVLAALAGVAEEIAAAMEDFGEGQKLRDNLAAMRKAVADDAGTLRHALQTLLAGPFAKHPVLLVLDDLEQSLLDPSAETAQVEPMPAFRPTLAAVLGVFAKAATPSRLLVTSRYDFRLEEAGGQDLTAGLARLALAPMRTREREKQLLARARAEGQELRQADAGAAKLLAEAVEAAAGNPGLQDVLTRPVLAGDAAAEAAIEAVRHFRATGQRPPEDQDPGDFFQRMAFHRYEEALAPGERTALAAALLFSPEMPVPRPALAAVATGLGLADPGRALDRLLALGLLDDWGSTAGWPGMAPVAHAAANPLARPLAAAPPADRVPALAAAALPHLAAAWQSDKGDFPYDPRAVEATRLARLAAPGDPALLDAAALAAVILLYDLRHDEPGALALGQPVLDALQAAGHPPGAVMLGKLVNAAERTGDTDLQGRLLDTALARDDLDPVQRGQFLGLRASRLIQSGAPEKARACLHEALELFNSSGEERLAAITIGQIADVLQARGETDKALRIRREELLPVFERLGDVRSRAITLGTIADVLQARGETDEALRIRREEMLPVFERLGDVRSCAVTLGRIADVLQARGETDEALRIRREEQLPVYERLGDVRAKAVTLQKIAAALIEGGGLEQGRHQEIYEALAEAFAIAKHLQIPDGIAFIGSQLAQVMAMRGLRDQALTVLDDAEAGFAKLGHAEGLEHVRQLRHEIGGDGA